MERAHMPPAEPPSLEHDTWGAPHPIAAYGKPLYINELRSPLPSRGYGAQLGELNCSQLEPGAVIRPDPGECHSRMPERLE